MISNLHQYRLNVQDKMASHDSSQAGTVHHRIHALERKQKALEQNLQFATFVVVTLGTGLALYKNWDTVSDAATTAWGKIPNAQQIQDSFNEGWEWMKGCFNRNENYPPSP